MPFQRIGKCNLCGQCCGAEGSPEQDNPWPKNIVRNRRKMSYTDFMKIWPQGLLLGVRENEQGLSEIGEQSGEAKIHGGSGGKYPYVWIDGRPCKATTDGSEHSLECPFLKDDPGDGTRPCGLVGTKHEPFYYVSCHDEVNGIPPNIVAFQENVDAWFRRHPLCSFEYMELTE